MDIVTVLQWVLITLCVAGGVVGTIFPALPGTPLIFIGILIAGWIHDFERVGVVTVVLAGILAIAGLAVDFIATSMGAKKVGASKLAVIGATVGTFAGLFFFPVGIILGPFVGAVLGEYYTNKDLLGAGKVGLGTWLGLLFGSAAKVVIAFSMVGLLITSLVW